MTVWLPLIVLVTVWIGGSILYARYETKRVRENPLLGPAGELVRPPKASRQDIREDPGGEAF